MFMDKIVKENIVLYGLKGSRGCVAKFYVCLGYKPEDWAEL